MTISSGAFSSFSGFPLERRAPILGRATAVESPYQKPVPWRHAVGQRLIELMHLNAGWDGYRAKPVKHENAVFALRVIEAICGEAIPQPQIVPGVNGDLQLEWHLNNGDVELHIVRPNYVHAWIEEEDEDGFELELKNDFSVVSARLASLMEKDLAAEPAAA